MSDISVDQMTWVRRLAQVRRTKKALEEQEREAVAQVREFLGNRRQLDYKGEKVLSATEVTQRRIDTKMLREEYPDVAEACTLPSTFLKLTVVDGVA